METIEPYVPALYDQGPGVERNMASRSVPRRMEANMRKDETYREMRLSCSLAGVDWKERATITLFGAEVRRDMHIWAVDVM